MLSSSIVSLHHTYAAEISSDLGVKFDRTI